MITKEESKNITISVKLKNGILFENKNIPTSPIGENDKLVCFYTYKRTILRCYPMSEIEYFEFKNIKEVT